MGISSTGGIKSIQRGTLNINGAISATATVSAVNTNKAILSLLGVKESATNTRNGTSIVLTNATTITATKATLNPDALVTWELVEWY